MLATEEIVLRRSLRNRPNRAQLGRILLFSPIFTELRRGNLSRSSKPGKYRVGTCHNMLVLGLSVHFIDTR